MKLPKISRFGIKPIRGPKEDLLHGIRVVHLSRPCQIGDIPHAQNAPHDEILVSRSVEAPEVDIPEKRLFFQGVHI